MFFKTRHKSQPPVDSLRGHIKNQTAAIARKARSLAQPRLSLRLPDVFITSSESSCLTAG